jgi:hypothetical protein
MKQLPLSFHKRVIFVDWHGVLSRDPFWLSITNKARHPLRAQLNTQVSKIFSHGSMVDEWMRGAITSQDIIRMMQVKTDQRFRSDFLARRLISDCAQMKVHERLARFLEQCTQRATVVLATDNMDCFAAAFEQARTGVRKRRGPSREEVGMRDLAPLFDDIVCSSDVGVLKAEGRVDKRSASTCDRHASRLAGASPAMALGRGEHVGEGKGARRNDRAHLKEEE